MPRPRRRPPHAGRVPAAPRPPARGDRHRRAALPSSAPESYEYQHFLGILLRRAGDFAAAADAQARALELNPGHAASRHELEQVLIRQADAEARRATPATRSRPEHDMAVVRFALSGADIARSEAVGLRLAGLRYTGALADGSRIEVPDLDRLRRAARRLPRRRRLLQPRRRQPQQRPDRPLLLDGERRDGRRARAPDRLADHLAHRLLPRIARLGRARRRPTPPPSVHARKRPYLTSCPVTTIGPDVWIGQGAFVKAGVTIGAGAIVGARATVLRDVPPYAIVVGTPARVVRLRFPERTVERLLRVAWWRYSIYDLFDAPMDSIDAALDTIEDLVARGAVRPYDGAGDRAGGAGRRRRARRVARRRRSWRGPADRQPDQVALGADAAAGAERHLDEVEPEGRAHGVEVARGARRVEERGVGVGRGRARSRGARAAAPARGARARSTTADRRRSSTRCRCAHPVRAAPRGRGHGELAAGVPRTTLETVLAMPASGAQMWRAGSAHVLAVGIGEAGGEGGAVPRAPVAGAAVHRPAHQAGAAALGPEAPPPRRRRRGGRRGGRCCSG